MKFPQHCAAATRALQQLSPLIEDMEAALLTLEETPRDLTLLTSLVQNLFRAKSLSEEVLYQYIPQIAEEEACIGEAIRIAHDELMKRAWSVRHDLEVMTKVKRTGSEKPVRLAG